MVADHAMLAAQAVADAEEASRKASSLLRAANELEDLHHRNLQAGRGEPLHRLLVASVHCTPCGQVQAHLDLCASAAPLPYMPYAVTANAEPSLSRHVHPHSSVTALASMTYT